MGTAREDSAQPSSVGHIPRRDRKSTRLNSSHTVISYAVFCLKKKKKRVSYREKSDVENHICRRRYSSKLGPVRAECYHVELSIVRRMLIEHDDHGTARVAVEI